MSNITYVVTGKLTQPDGYPLAGMKIKVFDQGLEAITLVGDARTGKDGSFRFAFPRPEEKLPPDLIVKAFDEVKKEIAASGVIYNATVEEIVNLVTRWGPSEYERLQGKVSPLMGAAAQLILQPEQITYLSKKTGLGATRLQRFADSRRAASETGLPEAFLYACARQGLPMDPAELAFQNPQKVRTAVAKALDENYIPDLTAEEIDAAQEALEGIAIDQHLQADNSPAAVLATSPIIDTEAKRRAIASIALKNPGAPPATWKQLASSPIFGGQITTIQPELDLTWRLGGLADNHVPMVQALQDKRGPDFGGVRDLAAWTLEEWQALAAESGAPADVPGDSDEERAANFGRALCETIEAEYPTAVIRAKVAAETEPTAAVATLNSFLQEQETFEFGTSRVFDYVREEEDAQKRQQVLAWDRLYKVAPAKKRCETMAALQEAGLHSAQAITRIGQETFIAKYAESLGGAEAAGLVWSKANSVSSMALALFGEFSSAMNQTSPAVIPGHAETADIIPEWEDLFGSLDYCACEHAESVYSPAAYLADLLNFLKHANPNEDDKRPLDVLLERRPDLAEIELSGTNTETLVPYIDLVLEILESAILPDYPGILFAIEGGFLQALSKGLVDVLFVNAGYPLRKDYSVEKRSDHWRITDKTHTYLVHQDNNHFNVYYRPTFYQTEAQESELEVLPEFLNEIAYAKLADSSYPWTLPFDLWREEARTYLEQLGFERYRWMERMVEGVGAQQKAACDYLDISELERQLIFGWEDEDESTAEYKLWGFELEHWQEGGDEVWWTDKLRQVDLLLKNSGLEANCNGSGFKLLNRLVGTEYINWDQGLFINMDDSAPCDSQKARICHTKGESFFEVSGLPGLYEPWLDILQRIRRFLRLQRKLGWRISELDKTITALKSGWIDRFLAGLATIEHLREELDVPLLEIVSWWGLLDTAEDRTASKEEDKEKSLYEEVFLDPSLENPAQSIFRLNDDRDELIIAEKESPTIRAHAGSIAAALGITAEELDTILVNISPKEEEEKEEESSKLNLQNLTGLYRIVSYSQVLKLTIEEYFLVRNILSEYDFFSIEQEWDIIQRIRTMQDSPFSLQELGYLLCDQDRPTDISSSVIQKFLDGLGDGLLEVQTKADNAQYTEDGRDTLIKDFIAQYLADSFQLDGDVAALILENLLIRINDERQSLIDVFTKMPTAGLEGTYNKLITYPNGDNPIKVYGIRTVQYVDFSWSGKNPPFTVEWKGFLRKESAEDTIFRIVAHGRKVNLRLDGETLLEADPGETIDVNIEKILGLAEGMHAIELTFGPESDENTIIELTWRTPLTTEKVISSLKLLPPEMESLFENAAKAYCLLDKLALFINRFQLTAFELSVMLQYKELFNNFNLYALVHGSPEDSYILWYPIHDLVVFRDLYPHPQMTLFDVFAAGADGKTALEDNLLQLTGWDPETFAVLSGKNGFNLKETDYISGAKLLDLHLAFRQIAKLGISADQFCRWVKAGLGEKALAGELRKAVKANYDQRQWLHVARPLRDDLRQKQRDALVAYLVYRYGLEDANDLYACYLIDVEMSPCMKTSRIKQAISSVQLFVQRCLMNLEPQVTLLPGEVGEWKWRKNYRIWEANRKVFLYPENWIEPELRDDKSPFFEELENELLQEQITDETVSVALRHYLEKLAGVARLEIAGVCEQHEPGEDPLYHVFGRTAGTPHVYYHREWVNKSYWTPWKRMNLEIEGNHLIPLFHNGKLHLFWPIFSEKSIKVDREELDNDGELALDKWEDAQVKYWEIQLAWSVYDQDKWSARRTSINWLSTVFTFDLVGEDGEEVKPSKITVPGEGDYLEEVQEGIEHGGSTRSPILLMADSGEPPPTFQDSLVLQNYTKLWKENDYLFWDTRFITFSAFKSDSQPLGNSAADIIVRCYLSGPNRTKIWPFGEFHFITCDGSITVFQRQYAIDENTITPPYQTMIDSMHFKEARWLTDDIYDSSRERLRLPIRGINPLDHYPLLDQTPTEFRLLTPQQHFTRADLGLGRSLPVFFEDKTRTLMIQPRWLSDLHRDECLFSLFYHPFACKFIKQLERFGVEGLFDPPLARLNSLVPRQGNQKEFFEDEYEPVMEHILDYDLSYVAQPYPKIDVDFNMEGAYALYNWELFFHIPLLIAGKLRNNQRFEEAQKWYHYIFDPTESPQRGFLGFYYNNRNLQELAFCRIDRTINFDWEDGSPMSGFKTNNFSVRWLGRITAPTTGTYTFSIYSDDGVRLWMNDDEPIINNWSDHPVGDLPDTGTIWMQAGQTYTIRMEFYEAGGKAVARLFWKTPDSSSEQPIPSSALDYVWTPYWKVKPFADQEETRPLHQLMRLLAKSSQGEITDEEKQIVAGINRQIDCWRQDPFKPHQIARLRLAAYMKAIVMMYLDNLIAWGDQLFRRDMIESINEATQLYILAAEILGRRPRTVPSPVKEANTYSELGELDAFSNALVEVENLLADCSPDVNGSSAQQASSLPDLSRLYFCIPNNQELYQYWDTVEDRLFKIRSCMTIEGVRRQLPLFQPPIDPALLVRAAAAGIDLGAVLRDLYAPLPGYRFQIVLQKAMELCADVRALGSGFLAAVEKRDAEHLALLRSSHEMRLLEVVREVRKQHVELSQEELDMLAHAYTIAKKRFDYYSSKIEEYMNPWEIAHISMIGTSLILQGVGQIGKLTAGGESLKPNASIGSLSIGPVTIATWGGSNLGPAVANWADAMEVAASIMSTGAGIVSTFGNYEQRKDEWELQRDLADEELDQIDKQKTAAEIRLAIAENELRNHELQMEQARTIDEQMHSKFTNKDLYDWMISQISAIYFQSYQLAHDLAKQAERAYRHELGIAESSFIQFGYWDSLKKGLLAGERLHLDLRRLEVAHMEKNKRAHELTRHISLAMQDPVALIRLREDGECHFNIPESTFDLDHPGHYMRRIKSVSLTIPCVTGPYTSVSAHLTMGNSRTRKDTNVTGGYAWSGDNNDTRFFYDLTGTKSIATSSGQNDSGLFELNFRDERYLPFEGAGVISTWHLKLPRSFRQFDYDTISDVIIHLHYTARYGGDDFREEVEAELDELLNDRLLEEGRSGLYHFFSLRRDFSNAFASIAKTGGPVKVPIELERLPYAFQGENVKVTFDEMRLLLMLQDGVGADSRTMELTPPQEGEGEEEPKAVPLAFDKVFESMSQILTADPQTECSFGTWKLSGEIDQEEIEDIGILCHYMVKIDD